MTIIKYVRPETSVLGITDLTMKQIYSLTQPIKQPQTIRDKYSSHKNTLDSPLGRNPLCIVRRLLLVEKGIGLTTEANYGEHWWSDGLSLVLYRAHIVTSLLHLHIYSERERERARERASKTYETEVSDT